jgi:predicted HicB family RNase H-like nuclease
MEKQLNVWIAEDLKDALTERAQQEKTTLRDVVEGTLQQDVARARGEEI